MADEPPKNWTKDSLEQFAQQTLVDHGLLRIPVNPVTVAEALDVRVSHAVFREPQIGGMSTRRSGVTQILIKQGDSTVRKRFTVAHEVGHCLLHLSGDTIEIVDRDEDFFRTSIPGGDPRVAAWTATRRREFEANVFAAALLMPRSEIARFWAMLPADDRNLSVMANVFQVSEEAMGYRLASQE